MVSFEQFVETCVSELVDETHTVEAITNQLTSLKTKYEKSPIWKNKALEQILAHYDHSIKSEAEINHKQLVYYDFKEEFKRLDKYLNTLKSKDKKERTKLMKKIKDLQTRIKKDLRKIDRLDQSEISLDDLDNENSDHMKKYKYEQRVKRTANKLLRLQGTKESARLLDKVYKYTGTPYKELNEAISTKYRAIMQKKYKGKIPQRPINSTPSIADINELIDNYCSEKGKTIPNKADLAFQITSDVIQEVQRRRELELNEMMNDYEHDSHLRPTTVPDLNDEALIQRLLSNEEKCRDSLIKKRDELKKKLEGVESTDIGGDEGTASDEDEDDEDDTIDDGIDDDDDDEEISEDETTETGEANPEDEDDEPIFLDEAGTTTATATENGETQAPVASSSNEIKKRSLSSNGTETNGDEPTKKVKFESQMKTESNSEVKEEISSVGENNGEIEMKEEPKGEKEEKEEKEQEEQTEKTKEEKEVKEVEEEMKEENAEKTEDPKQVKENLPEENKPSEGQISNEPKEELAKEENDKKSEEPKITNNQSEDEQISLSSTVEIDPPKSVSKESEVKSGANQPKTTKCEPDNVISIVDLEEENRLMDDQSVDDDDDDDVICLD